MDSRDSLDQTPHSIDLTESPVKHTNTQQKINEDTNDDDTDDMIDFDKDKAKKTCRKNANEQRKWAKTVKTKKGRTIKMCTINIERKKLLKQRGEKALQNAKDRKIVKGNFLAALRADHRANRASNHIQDTVNTNDELINGSDTDNVIGAKHIDNDVLNAENIDKAAINEDKTSNTATDGEKSDDAAMGNDSIDNTAMSDDSTDNAAVSDNNTDDTILGDGNIENTETGEISTKDILSPLLYGRKTTDASKLLKSTYLLGSSLQNLQLMTIILIKWLQ